MTHDELNQISISVVVPVFRESSNVVPLLRRLVPVLNDLVGECYEVIFAIDPSDDGTESAVEAEALHSPNIRGIIFSRRVGQPTATLAGLEAARGLTVVVMDADLQDPPELIKSMFQLWTEGYKVVYGRRRKRDGEPIIKRAVAKVGYAVIDRFGEVSIPRDTGDFRLMDRQVVNELLRFRETHGFLRGLVALVGFKQGEVLFDRPARYSGTSSYNRFFGSIRIGMNGLVGFSSALLNLATVLGLITAISSMILGLSYAILSALGFPFPVGNPTIVTLLLFVGGIQLICIGIMGQYIGRIYDEVKRRPRYIIDRLLN